MFLVGLPFIFCSDVSGQVLQGLGNCKQANHDFNQDLDSGFVRLYEPGGIDYSNTYERLLLDRHHVKFIETDRYVLTPYEACYNRKSTVWIGLHVGDSAKRSTRREAWVMDTSGLGDRPPKYIGNEDSINTFFNEHVHDSFFSRFVGERGYESMYVHMWVDSSGKLTKLRSYGHYNLPIQKEMDKLVEVFPYRARPATDDGKPAPGRTSVHITFWPSKD